MYEILYVILFIIVFFFNMEMFLVGILIIEFIINSCVYIIIIIKVFIVDILGIWLLYL